MKKILDGGSDFKIREVLKELNKVMEDHFDELKESLVETLDISDLGNIIGIVIAKYFNKDNTRDDFESGINHGISLTDGTHSGFVEAKKRYGDPKTENGVVRDVVEAKIAHFMAGVKYAQKYLKDKLRIKDKKTE